MATDWNIREVELQERRKFQGEKYVWMVSARKIVKGDFILVYQEADKFQSTPSADYLRADFFITKVKEISYFGGYWDFTVDISQEQKVTVRNVQLVTVLVDFVDREISSDYSWLKNVPASDVGFKTTLAQAPKYVIEAVLAELPEDQEKTRRKALEG